MSQATDRNDSDRDSATRFFHVRCICGVAVGGVGLDDDHRVPCPWCGRSLHAGGRAATAAYAAPRFGERLSANVIHRLRSWRIALTRVASDVRRVMTRGRVVVAAAAVLLAATGWWSWSTFRDRSALQTLATLTPRGLRALEEGRFEDAANLLAKAAKAARIVGGNSPPARMAIQFHHEANIWSRLASYELDQFFLERPDEDLSQIVAAFDHRFAGRTMIFDGRLSVDTDGELAHTQPVVQHFDWEWIADKYTIGVDLADVRAFEKLERNGPRRVIFGAEIRGLRCSEHAPHGWITVKPESVTLLTVAAPLARWHWSGESSWRLIVEEQRQGLGIAE